MPYLRRPKSARRMNARPRGRSGYGAWVFEQDAIDKLSGAYKVKPVMTSEVDMAQLHPPHYEIDEAATRAMVERATEIVGGRLPVKVATNVLGGTPSETVVSLMGIKKVLYDVIDRPAFVHRIMDHVTEGFIAYHRQREAAGAVDPEEMWARPRVHYEELPSDVDTRRLSYSWSGVSAQSLSGLSPDMYAESLQPYDARLAEILGENRIYYHACEDITAKIPIIRQLPNLRRFHVSAWTDLEVAAEQLGRDFVLEVDVHPGDTLLVHTPDQMRQALEKRMAMASDSIADVNLRDIHTVNGNPSVLTTWIEIVQEVTARYA
jgi:uroporphyrinogen-III decarboxylase